MDLVTCPFCNNEIENDSFYCDQCGEELKVCATHGFKKGKICNECGTKLVEAKSIAVNDQAAVTAQAAGFGSQITITSAEAVQTVQAVADDASEKTVRPTTAPVEPKYLVSDTLDARLELKNGAVVGRRAGDYTHIFGGQGYVSGSHARLQKNGAGQWEVVDLDSSNGTFLNGRKLTANQPAIFKIGDTVAFYDLKFVVSE